MILDIVPNACKRCHSRICGLQLEFGGCQQPLNHIFLKIIWFKSRAWYGLIVFVVIYLLLWNKFLFLEFLVKCVQLTLTFKEVVSLKIHLHNTHFYSMQIYQKHTLQFVSSKLALFTDQIVGSINSVQVSLGIKKSDAVESLDFLVWTQMYILADSVWIFLEKDRILQILI